MLSLMIGANGSPFRAWESKLEKFKRSTLYYAYRHEPREGNRGSCF
jgi:hypothetical protein